MALPISESITVGPECDVKTLEGMRVVSYIHKGPYQDVGVAHEVIHEYMARDGLKVKCLPRGLLKRPEQDA